MNTLTKLCCFALFLSVWMSSTTEARQPMGIAMTGTVRSVDVPLHKIVFAQDDGPVRVLVWSNWAKFRHDHLDVLPAHLQPGMRVQVKVHNPLFGADYVTRIVLLAPPREVGGKRQQVKPQPSGGFPARGFRELVESTIGLHPIREPHRMGY